MTVSRRSFLAQASATIVLAGCGARVKDQPEEFGPLTEDAIPTTTPSVGEQRIVVANLDGIVSRAALTAAHIWMLLDFSTHLRLVRLPRVGGAIEDMTGPDGQAGSFALDEHHVFFSAADVLWRRTHDPRAGVDRVASIAGRPVVDATHVYVSGKEGVGRVDKATGAIEALAPREELWLTPWGIAVDPDEFHWLTLDARSSALAEAPGILRSRRKRGGATTTVFTDHKHVSGVLADRTGTYWVSQRGVFRRRRREPREIEHLYTNDPRSTNGFAMNSTALFWDEGGVQSRIVMMRKDGGPTTVVAEGKNIGLRAADDLGVLWYSSGDATTPRKLMETSLVP